MFDNSDPTRDPNFKQVVDHFLKTPPKPHKRKKDKGVTEAEKPIPAAPQGRQERGKPE